MAFSVTVLIMVTGCWDKMFIRQRAPIAPHTSLPTPLMKTTFPQTALRNSSDYSFFNSA